MVKVAVSSASRLGSAARRCSECSVVSKRPELSSEVAEGGDDGILGVVTTERIGRGEAVADGKSGEGRSAVGDGIGGVASLSDCVVDICFTHFVLPCLRALTPDTGVESLRSAKGTLIWFVCTLKSASLSRRRSVSACY